MANLSNINDKFLVTTTGEILIGQTANNGNRLQITGADGASYIYLKTDVATTGGRIGFNGDALRVFNQQASGELNLGTAGTTRLTIDSSGNSTFAGNVTAPSIASTDTSGRYFMIQNAAGNQTYPVYSFRTDGNTGMMNPGADILSLVTGGTTRLTINNSSSTFAGLVTAPNFNFNENIYKVESAGATRGLYSVQPHGGDYYTQTSTKTGYLKIVLPITSNLDDMIKFTVDIYLYGNDTALTAHFGGYVTGSLAWGNTTATIMSGKASLNYTVRFGNDGTNFCVYIGESNTTWSYPQVVIRNFFAGYGAVTGNDYLNEWAIDFTTTLGTISETRTNNFPLSSGSTSAGMWSISGNDIYNSNSGNVGIGTTSPAYPLEVESSGGNAYVFSENTAAGGASGFRWKTPDSEFSWYSAGGTNNMNLYDYTASAIRMTIDSSGVVTVGAAKRYVDSGNTQFDLEVTEGMAFGGSAFTFATIQGDSAGNGNIEICANAYPANTGTEAKITFKTATSGGGQNDKALVIKGPNVGIGTDSPQQLLHINKAGNTTKPGIQVQGGVFGFTLGKAPQSADYVHLKPLGSGISVLRVMPNNSSSTSYIEAWGTDYEADTVNWNRIYMNVTGSSGNATITTDSQGTGAVGNLYLGTNSNQQTLTILDSGNVGIGATSPGYKLQVQGTGYYSGQLTVDGFAGNSGISFRTGISITNVGIRAKAVGTTNRDGLELLGYNGIDFTVNSGLNVAMRIVGVTGSGMGNVGIGTTSPVAKLEVVEVSGTNAFNQSNNGAKIGRIQYGWYTGRIFSNNTAYVHIKTSLWMGQGPAGNTQYIMGGFTAKSYSYSASGYGEGSCMFHNWGGSFPNLSVTNRGSWATFMQSPYTSTDGYCVIVLRHNYYSTPNIDFHQEYTGYPWRQVSVTASSVSANTTGVY